MKLTDGQFVLAHALALAYGHEWATALDSTSALRDPEEIAENTRQVRWEDSMAGIEAPEMEDPGTGYEDEQGMVVHTTGTGRLSWEIFPCGTVQLFVCRPAGKVLGVSVTPDEKIEAWAFDDALYAERHIRALLPALEALETAGAVVCAEIRKALDHLRPTPLYQYRITPEDGENQYDGSFYIDVPRVGTEGDCGADLAPLGVAIIRRGQRE